MAAITNSTTVEAAQASTSPSRRRPSKLPGVDGMRALAVSGVVLYHLDPAWLPGGYLGVDVFFVISGFLITRLLIAERSNTGRISLRQFWIRRARRILAPLLPMLAVTVVVAAIADRSLLHALRTEVLGALTFTSNWVQISEQQSYFAKFGPPSLLQHLWSLAVEEQFYLFWPVVVLAVLHWRRRSGARAVAVVAGLGALSSATAMAVMYQPGTDPSPIYYSTATHSAGLFVGAVLAVAWPAAATRAHWSPRRMSDHSALAGIGILGVALGYWLLDEYSAAAYQGGILAVSVAAALLIVGAGDGRTAIGKLLSRPSMRWLGARSYGLYLWHWPVFVLGDHILGPRTLVVAVVQVAVAVLLAGASYRWIEMPVMRRGYRGALRACGRAVRVLVAGVTAVSVAFVVAALVWAPPPPLAGLDQQLADALAVQESRPRSMPVPDPPPPPDGAPPAPAGPPPGDQISAVGDSVMLASLFALQDHLPGIQVDAATNRAMQTAPDIIGGLAASGQLRPVVLLGLGTNGPFPRDLLEGVLTTIGPDRTVFLVNLYLHDRPWTDEVNQTLTDVALAHPANVHLIDWQSAVSGHEDLLYSDGIHPQPGAGADLYAQTVIAAMIAAATPPPPEVPVVTLESLIDSARSAITTLSPTQRISASPTTERGDEFGVALTALIVLIGGAVGIVVAALTAGRTRLAITMPASATPASCPLVGIPARARSPPRAEE